MGRHSSPDDDSDEGSGRTAGAPDAFADPTAGAPGAPAPGGAAADLQLLREEPALRARAFAAALTPFVLYAVVLLAVGSVGEFLIWVWIPIVVAGVAVGSVLDLGHRRRG